MPIVSRTLNYCIIGCIAAFLTASLVLCAHSGNHSHEDVRQREIELKVAPGGDLVLLPVTIHDRAYSFLLDTGATGNAYDISLLPSAKPIRTVISRTFSGKASVPIYEGPKSNVASMPLEHGEGITISNLKALSIATGYNVKGMIGMSHLRNHIVQIDFDRGIVRFLEKESRLEGERFELSTDLGVYSINVKLGTTESAAVIVDTGFNNELSLESGVFDLVRFSGELKESRPRRYRIVSANGVVSSTRRGTLAELSFGTFNFTDVAVSRSNGINAIGLALLSRFLVTFDFPNQKLYLKPGKTFGRPSWRDASGFAMMVKEDRVVIVDVDTGSAAADIGIEDGDILLEVDGRDARKSSLFELRVLFTRAGEKHRLKVRRGDEVRTHEILLRELD